jgi:hypothetical protein
LKFIKFRTFFIFKHFSILKLFEFEIF